MRVNFVAFATGTHYQLRWAIAVLVLAVFAAPQWAAAQIEVDVAEGVTYGAHCSLQEAIYATEFKTNAALGATDPDSAYVTGCSDPSGSWDTIDLPGGTLTFTKSWDGDAHNPFGPTATPIIFRHNRERCERTGSMAMVNPTIRLQS